jgi:hypothetical protein
MWSSTNTKVEPYFDSLFRARVSYKFSWKCDEVYLSGPAAPLPAPPPQGKLAANHFWGETPN